MSARIDLELRAVPEAPGEARQALAGLAGDFQPGFLDEVRLLVSELVTNSYKHSSSGPDGLIRLRIDITAEVLRVEVCDAGAGFDPAVLPSGAQASGWGLYLVHQIVDRWGVNPRDGCCVWFELDARLGSV